MKPKKHIAEQFPLIAPVEAKPKPVRISFDLTGNDAARFNAAVASFAELEASASQVAKMLLKIGLNTVEDRA